MTVQLTEFPTVPTTGTGHIAYGPNNEIYVERIVNNNAVLYVSTNNGMTFTPALTVNQFVTNGTRVGFADLCVDASGRVYIVYDEYIAGGGLPDNLWLRIYENGALSAPELIDSQFLAAGAAFRIPRVDIDSVGNLHVVYRKYLSGVAGHIYHRRRTPAGVWGAITQLTNYATAGSLDGPDAMAIGAGDSIHVIASESVSYQPDYIYFSGGVWQTRTLGSPGCYGGVGCVDASGVFHYAYYDSLRQLYVVDDRYEVIGDPVLINYDLAVDGAGLLYLVGTTQAIDPLSGFSRDIMYVATLPGDKAPVLRSAYDGIDLNYSDKVNSLTPARSIPASGCHLLVELNNLVGGADMAGLWKFIPDAVNLAPAVTTLPATEVK